MVKIITMWALAAALLMAQGCGQKRALYLIDDSAVEEPEVAREAELLNKSEPISAEPAEDQE